MSGYDSRLVKKAARSIKGPYRACDVAEVIKLATGKDYRHGAISNILQATKGISSTTELVKVTGVTTYRRTVFVNAGDEDSLAKEMSP